MTAVGNQSRTPFGQGGNDAMGASSRRVGDSGTGAHVRTHGAGRSKPDDGAENNPLLDPTLQTDDQRVSRDNANRNLMRITGRMDLTALDQADGARLKRDDEERRAAEATAGLSVKVPIRI